jgi:hypothetical protein
LKILNERTFQIRVQVVLHEDVEGLDNDDAMGRLWRRERVAGNVDLSVASSSELLVNIVSPVKPAIDQ